MKNDLNLYRMTPLGKTFFNVRMWSMKYSRWRLSAMITSIFSRSQHGMWRHRKHCATCL